MTAVALAGGQFTEWLYKHRRLIDALPNNLCTPFKQSLAARVIKLHADRKTVLCSSQTAQHNPRLLPSLTQCPRARVAARWAELCHRGKPSLDFILYRRNSASHCKFESCLLKLCSRVFNAGAAHKLFTSGLLSIKEPSKTERRMSVSLRVITYIESL